MSIEGDSKKPNIKRNIDEEINKATRVNEESNEQIRPPPTSLYLSAVITNMVSSNLELSSW